MTNVAIVVLILFTQLATATLGVCLGMKQEGLRSKLKYIVPFVMLGLVTVGLTGWQAYRTQSRSQTVREGLGSLIGEGRAIQLRCAEESSPVPEQEANEWASKAETFLRDHLGDSYVSRFRSHAGLPMSATTISSNPHRQLWGNIHFRLARLEQFSEENVK